ncbi:hypothetical protein GCM10017044_28910 [Kordiimonas sediminis]|uniref:Helix-turn-helix domain-containing protein n=1 Tax=Kordiimonas sediminis TaxID=1735581 RepID=A0A919EB81_9PROT|nr:helix-turn-helix domain-containing protein [Kordiimonas sediminis]GHF32207.1 hypothetical protein GCM10017044_28910 [Kordiimonas sediminis]
MSHSTTAAVAAPLLNERQAAAYLNQSVRTLQGWRLRGGGPRFVKISGRSVRYRIEDINAWIEGRIVANTSEIVGEPANDA